MKDKREEILIALPVILVKENEYYIISCDALGVYAQSKDESTVAEGFRKTLETFFNSLEKRQDLPEFLFEKNLIQSGLSSLKIKDFPAPKLKLGHYTNFQVPAYA